MKGDLDGLLYPEDVDSRFTRIRKYDEDLVLLLIVELHMSLDTAAQLFCKQGACILVVGVHLDVDSVQSDLEVSIQGSVFSKKSRLSIATWYHIRISRSQNLTFDKVIGIKVRKHAVFCAISD